MQSSNSLGSYPVGIWKCPILASGDFTDLVSAPHFDSVKEKNYSNTYYNNKQDFIQDVARSVKNITIGEKDRAQLQVQ